MRVSIRRSRSAVGPRGTWPLLRLRHRACSCSRRCAPDAALRLCLRQNHRRNPGGLGETLGELGEFRLRTIPIFILKSRHGCRKRAFFPRISGKHLRPAQNQNEQNQKSLPQ